MEIDSATENIDILLSASILFYNVYPPRECPINI